MKRRVVVTGLGIVTSLSCQVEDLWRRLLAGESGIHPLRILDTERFKVKFGGDVYDWEPERWPAAFLASPDGFTEKKEIKRLDRFSQFGMVAAWQAVQESAIDFSKEDPYRCGVILGSGIGGLNEIEEGCAKLIEKGPDRVSPFVVPKMMLNAAGGNISIRYGLRGINYSVATACASANNAIGDAMQAIQHGACDVVVTGGTEAAITRMGLAGFQNMKALSTRNDDPPRASRPFDTERDGFVLSEGAGLLVVEEYEHAKARGAKIYCELIGFGASADAGHITAPDERGTGAGRAMSDALKDAALNPGDIGYINAHGTSTPLGDKAETQAIKRVFGEHAKKVSISSTKSQLGHSLGASGGIEMVVTVRALAEGVVPPTINLTNPDPDCDLDYTPNTAKQRRFNYAMSNSFGFGGHNASVIIGRLANGKA
ncbi:MAG: beta-ketoacyl-ACP synthase II [Planctomycetaceae bacterium]|nr:beta-ketoacyl-ACP synthase II [Planctomycetaceae bacterium]